MKDFVKLNKDFVKFEMFMEMSGLKKMDLKKIERLQFSWNNDIVFTSILFCCRKMMKSKCAIVLQFQVTYWFTSIVFCKRMLSSVIPGP
jgi:hypothetical protein